MKIYIVLVLSAVTMAFATGYFALFMQGSHTSTPLDAIRIVELKTKFRTQNDALAIMNFNSVYYLREQYQLLDPSYAVPKKESQFNDKSDCFGGFARQMNPLVSEKVWIWEEFRCNLRQNLPTNFFYQSPFIHPSGQSYAYLAYLSHSFPYQTSAWIKAHLSLFHVTELREIKKHIGELEGVYWILEQMDNSALSALSSGKNSILTKKYYMLKTVSHPNNPNLEYWIYKKLDLDRFLMDSPYYVKPFKQGHHCFYRDGQICWDYNVRHLFKMASKSTLIIFFGSLLIITLVVWLLLNRIQGQRREDEKRRLALQVLTHEFRTPISNMLLLIERLNRKFNELDEDSQDNLIRLSADVYRLQRLTEMSRNYLRADMSKKIIQAKASEITSVNEYICELIDIEQMQVELDLLPEDRSFRFDPYWIAICLKNILENAFRHGTPPVSLQARLVKDYLVIKIQDTGECSFHSIQEMASPFVKGLKSEGTGLGLNIVKKVIEDLGGELSFSSHPTTFTLKIRNAA